MAGYATVFKGLNPCCNGKCSWRFSVITCESSYGSVSILVVMENALGGNVANIKVESLIVVSILVVMENALGVLQQLML